MSRTLVAFHAHPDDEALLTAGTMARAAAEGHRVVLVLATDGGGAEIARTPRVLEATVPRDTIVRAVRTVGRVYRFPTEFDPTSFERAYTARADITHRIDVRRYAGAKRASMRAHASQSTGGGASEVGDGAQTGDRTLAAFLKIPRPIYDVVFGREWFRDPSLAPGGPVRTDVFEGI